MSSFRSLVLPLLCALALVPPAARGQRPSGSAPVELPLKYVGKPTTAAITAADLMTRLYIFADDSMMGRRVGTDDNLKGTAYIASELRRLGLRPAGDDGDYFQDIPLFSHFADSASTLSVGGELLGFGADYLPVGGGETVLMLQGAPAIYGGVLTDSSSWIGGDAVAGKVVVLSVPAAGASWRSALFLASSRFGRAAAVVVPIYDRLQPATRAYLARRSLLRRDAGVPHPGPITLFTTARVGGLLFGTIAMNNLIVGTPSRVVEGKIVVHMAHAPGRNVVALLPGSDRRLKGQYVAIGAHNDHIGYNTRPVDHDSIRAFNIVARPQGADSPEPTSLTTEQSARIRATTDSLHRLHGVRRDSIFNGADDDGSGSVSLLEIAERLAGSRVKPRRSILFVWHTGEEAGLYGAEHFTDHPTVPRDSIVAQLNMDMVGRGGAADVTGETKTGELVHGGESYLQLVGSRRLSTELGDLIERVNTGKGLGFRFDYSQDANGHPQRIYCRSDHYEYARYGIPIVFITTGGHADYHQVTDEPQYIDYQRMAKVATLVHDVAWTVANLDHRVVVDRAVPDPKGQCVQ
jgi:hypothetical protein